MGLMPLGQMLRTPPRPSPITLTKDVTYATIRSAAQKIDLYAPATAQRLTVLHVHGGAWSSVTATKDLEAEHIYPRMLAHFGGALVAEMEYPLIPVLSGNVDTTYRQQMIDAVIAAIAWLRANAATYNGSTSRIVAWGESAGGHLVLMAAAQTAGLGTGPNMVVAISAATRLDKTPNDSVVQNYLGIAIDNSTGAGQVTAQGLSPYNQWTVPNVPVYLLCDINSPLGEISETRDMATKIGTVGGVVTKVETNYGIHADFNTQPELLAAYRACQVALAA